MCDQIVHALDANKDVRIGTPSPVSSMHWVFRRPPSPNMLFGPATFERGSMPIGGLFVSPHPCEDYAVGMHFFWNGHKAPARRIKCENPRIAARHTELFLALTSSWHAFGHSKTLHIPSSTTTCEGMGSAECSTIGRHISHAERQCRKLSTGPISWSA
jgi:hypothetical protein